MKRQSTILPLILAAVALVTVAGCATPEARIKDNPTAYTQLTPEQQALVKAGHVGLGMPQDGVRLALGKPDHVTEHTDASGVQQVWHYVQVDTSYVYASPYPYYGYGGYPRFNTPFFFPGGYGGFYGNAPVQTESDKMRVVFKDGKVTAIEREL
jgi:outer membrane protein assembly factor BamE (lipoprotein component of BamABCDE complex)